ncbi:hypothetical protein EV701_101464 [Chthoniobacter flavus]|nr:hypothetical protein EV701_101464 [Chthoniobacter flavus]
MGKEIDWVKRTHLFPLVLFVPRWKCGKSNQYLLGSNQSGRAEAVLIT